MALVVVNNATLQCDKGAVPGYLVLPSNTVECGGVTAARVTDNVPGVNLAIYPFSLCNADGLKPCEPVILANWVNLANVTFAGSPFVLLQGSTLRCEKGGTITIVDPGQTTVDLCAHGLPDVPNVEDQASGEDTSGGGPCSVDACAGAACGEDASGVGLCSIAECAEAACGGAACGGAACGGDACGGAACGEAACGAAACAADACGAAACLVDIAPIDACAIDGCVVNVIPGLPLI